MNKKEHMEDIIFYMEKYHYENICLEDDEAKFIHDYIINLHSKIDKAIEMLKTMKYAELLVGGKYKSNIDMLLDILKDSESNE